MIPIDTVYQQILREIVPSLTTVGYTFNEAYAVPGAGEVFGTEEDLHLPFVKPLGTLGYGHISLLYSPHAYLEEQQFTVRLLRYDEPAPFEIAAIPILGINRTFITGYLPRTPQFPLPLSMRRHPWSFRSVAELTMQLRAVQQRLVSIVLPWIECATSSQFVHIEPAWLVEPFTKYLDTTWDAVTTYAALAPFRMPEMYIEAGDVEQSYLVNVIFVLLEHLQPPDSGESPSPAVLAYLLNSLTGEMQFQIKEFEALQRATR